MVQGMAQTPRGAQRFLERAPIPFYMEAVWVEL